jgi:hypothetical protein
MALFAVEATTAAITAAEIAAAAEAAAVAEAAAIAAATAETAAATTAAAQAASTAGGLGVLGTEAGLGALGSSGGLGALGTEAGLSEFLANPELYGNGLAELVQSEAANSGIMQAANPELMQSAANFAPETSMYGPGSEQFAGPGFNYPTESIPSTYTPGQASPYSNAAGNPNISANNPTGLQQFSNPSSTGTGFTNTMPANVPGATPPVPSDPSAYQYNPATGEYTSSQSPFMRGLNSVIDYAEKNPYRTAAGAYMGASKLGLLDQKGMDAPAPYNGPLSKYRMSPDFQGRQVNPEDYRYTPRQYEMAAGGIAQIPSYAKGSRVDESYFTDMIDPKYKELPVYRGEIARDDDPDTRYLDPLTAAMVRQSKLDSRSYVDTKSKFNKPTPMGTLNFKPVAAAHGGIMGASNLGGYAAGGNPRLLRGPGDGMSDNIPATINNRQPARLADGEFVVPADVVSHLGNGSTEAGAKRLHEMMTQIRKARTGNPKQGKQINPNKYIPK